MVKRATMTPVAEVEPPAQVHEVLGFVIDDEHYGVPLHSVREILKVPPVTPVPRAPFDVVGIISVRGRIVTVIDLRKLLRSDERTEGKYARVLLVDSGVEVMGLLVDRVLQVFRLVEEEVEAASVVGGDLSEHVLGIGRPTAAARDRSSSGVPDMLILLDPGTLLKR